MFFCEPVCRRRRLPRLPRHRRRRPHRLGRKTIVFLKKNKTDFLRVNRALT